MTSSGIQFTFFNLAFQDLILLLNRSGHLTCHFFMLRLVSKDGLVKDRWGTNIWDWTNHRRWLEGRDTVTKERGDAWKEEGFIIMFK